MASVLRRRGRIQVRLDQQERAALLDIVGRLEATVPAALAASRPAYEDAAMQSEFDRWVRPDLDQGMESDNEVVRECLASGDDVLVLTEMQVHAWLRSFNQLRLAAGNTLGITDDGWESDANAGTRGRPEFGMLMALGWLQEELISALES